jgi:alkylation response protein AidB-like acyl-CoA dehydrogenase
VHINTAPAIEVAKHLAHEFATRADEADRAGKLPAEDVQALKDTGYLGISIPKLYGGQELSLGECVEAHLELAQGSTSTALVAAMPIILFGNAREMQPWPEPALRRLCLATVTEGALVNSVASEPLLGSPSRGGLPATYASPNPDNDGWLINGHKTWITGGRFLTHMVVSLRIDDDLATMLILHDSPGVEWVDTWGDALSLRASDSHDVYFKDVLEPEENLLQRGGSPAKGPLHAWAPMIISSVYLGAAFAARNALIKYALERVPSALGKPIATLPKIQRQIGEIDVALQAARALLFEVAHQWTGRFEDHPRLYPRIVAAKCQAIAAASEATEKALHVAGGLSITRALPLERHFRDVQAGAMHPPSGDAAFEIVGRQAIGKL